MPNPAIPQDRYPRITLHCGECKNEFQINVMRFTQPEAVLCQICGTRFPKELGEEFVQSLEALFNVKVGLEKQKSAFDISFVYKSTFGQPPAPHPFCEADFVQNEKEGKTD